MSSISEKVTSDALYRALLALETVEDGRRFLEDLCTISEIKALEQRMDVAVLLDEGYIYQDILQMTGASSATISRVNRCLHYGANGYKTVIPKLKKSRKIAK